MDILPLDTRSEPRSSTTYSTVRSISSKLKEQYPTIKLHTRRTKRSLSYLIQSCSPIWLLPSATLSLLALAIRLLPFTTSHNPPPTYPDLTSPVFTYLSTALYLASLALFLPTTLLLFLRLTLFPHATRAAARHERDTSGLGMAYAAAGPATWNCLVAFAGFADAEGRLGNGEAWAVVLGVTWWVGFVASAAVVAFVMVCLLSSRTRSSHRTGGGRFAPLVGMVMCVEGLGTAALVGGLLAWLRTEGGDEGVLREGMAAPVVVVSFCAAGAAWLMANLVYGVLLHELVLVMGWPPQEQTPTVFSLVGPLAQCASALLLLAKAASRYDGDVYRREGGVEEGMVTGLAAMAPLEVVSVLLALIMGGMAVVWLVLGCITVVYRFSRRELTWNQDWHGIVPPIVTLAILSLLLGMELDSSFLRICACVLIILSAVVLVVNLGFTIWHALAARRKSRNVEIGDVEMA